MSPAIQFSRESRATALPTHDAASPRVFLLATQSATLYKFVLPQAENLKKCGYDVVLGCSPDEQDDVPSFHREIRDLGYELIDVPIPRGVQIGSDIAAVKFLTKYLKGQNFQFVHTANSKAGLIGRIAAKLAGVPFIIHTNHGLPFFKADKFSLSRSCIFWLLEWVVARFTTRIISVSSVEVEKAARFGIAKPPKMKLIWNGIRPQEYSRKVAETYPTDPRVADAKKRCESKSVIGAVGRLVTEKGIDTLLLAAAKVKKEVGEVAVLIVGDGPERRNLEELASSLGLTQDVIFVGSVMEQPVVVQCYALLDIFVLPTRWESFGMVFAEAMSMELPVVGPAQEPISSVVANNETGLLVEPEDVDGYAAAIITLLRDRSLYQKMSEAGPTRVQARFSEERMVGETEALYRELLSEKEA